MIKTILILTGIVLSFGIAYSSFAIENVVNPAEPACTSELILNAAKSAGLVFELEQDGDSQLEKNPYKTTGRSADYSTFYACKFLGNKPLIAAIAFANTPTNNNSQAGENNYDLTVVIVDAVNQKTLASYVKAGDVPSGEPANIASRLTEFTFDTADYNLSTDAISFGIRATNQSHSSFVIDYQTTLSLFSLQKSSFFWFKKYQLNKVLDKLKVSHFVGATIQGDCETSIFNQTESKINSTANKINNWYDLTMQTIESKVEVPNPCPKDTSLKRKTTKIGEKQQILQFNGKTYSAK